MNAVLAKPLPSELENQAFWYLAAIERMRHGLSQGQIKRDRSCRDIWHVMRAIYLSEHRRFPRTVNGDELRKFIKDRIDPAFCTGQWLQRVELVLFALQLSGALQVRDDPRGPMLSIAEHDPLLHACVKGLD